MRIFVAVFISACLLSCTTAEEKEDNDVRIIIDSPNNLILANPMVRPTSKPVSHEPGVPPVISVPNRPASTNRPPFINRPPINNRPSNINNNFNRPNNNNNNPFNWFSSLFGNKNPSLVIRNPENFTELLHLNESLSAEVMENILRLNNSAEWLESMNITDGVTSEQLVLLKPSNLTYGVLGTETASKPTEPNKGVVDWILGLVGIQTGGNGGNKPKPEPEPPKTCGKCSCGVGYTQTRIVGGIETKVNAYPWMTILQYNGRFYCGATVINNKYLLTATHCVNGFTKERLSAVFLDHDRSSQFETKTFTRKITAILKHRGYNMGGSYNNDIALLRLDQDLPFNGLLRPVCLPSTGKSYTGYTGIVTGWGATQEHGQVSQKLREVSVPIISNIDCRKTGYGSKITDNMLCAGYKTGGKDSCQGDSGGPLHIVNNTFHSIVGVVSWGEGCAEANYPGVYTRVNRYISWIKSNTKDACYCS